MGNTCCGTAGGETAEAEAKTHCPIEAEAERKESCGAKRKSSVGGVEDRKRSRLRLLPKATGTNRSLPSTLLGGRQAVRRHAISSHPHQDQHPFGSRNPKLGCGIRRQFAVSPLSPERLQSALDKELAGGLTPTPAASSDAVFQQLSALGDHFTDRIRERALHSSLQHCCFTLSEVNEIVQEKRDSMLGAVANSPEPFRSGLVVTPVRPESKVKLLLPVYSSPSPPHLSAVLDHEQKQFRCSLSSTLSFTSLVHHSGSGVVMFVDADETTVGSFENGSTLIG